MGLAASAHRRAAAGGDGLLEIDANANPLQGGLWPAMPELDDGRLMLPELPGLGVEPDAQTLQRHRVASAGGRRPPRVRRLYFRTVSRVLSKRTTSTSIQHDEHADHAHHTPKQPT